MFWRSTPVDLPSPDVLHKKVTETLQITPIDLQANRMGKLSESQCQQFAGLIQEGQRVAMIMVPLMLLIFFGIIGVQIFAKQEAGNALVRAFQENPVVPVVGIGGSLLLYVGIIAFTMWRTRRMNVADLKVKSAEGKVSVSKLEADGEAYMIARAVGGQTTSFLVKVGRKKIYSMNLAAENAFVNGGQYRVYYTRLNHIDYLVSAEVLG